jgi:hypothetical protein
LKFAKAPSHDPAERADSDDFATTEDIEWAIGLLSEGDWARLALIAERFFRTRSLKSTWAEPCDLLQEAILRTLHGERRWPRKRVSFTQHLARTMESVSGHLAEHRETQTRHQALIPQPLRPSSPAHALESKEELDNLRRYLAGTSKAWEFLMLKAEGQSAALIMSQLELSLSAYEAIRKKVQRTLTRLPKTGDRHGR